MLLICKLTKLQWLLEYVILICQIDIAHRVSGIAPVIVLFNRKADRTNFYRQKNKLFKGQANHIVKPNNDDHSDNEVSLPGLQWENSYNCMNKILTSKKRISWIYSQGHC